MNSTPNALVTDEMLVIGAQAWIDHEGDDAGRAAIEAVAPLVADVVRRQTLAEVTSAIGGLRDVLVSTSGETGSYLVAAVLGKAIDIANAAIYPLTGGDA